MKTLSMRVCIAALAMILGSAVTDYAAIMAYMLSYECVKPSGEGKTPFPTGDISALKPITFGAKVCPPGGGKE